LLVVSFITSLKPTFCTALNTQNTTDNNYIILHTPRPLDFSEGQLHAPESLTVLRHEATLCVTTRKRMKKTNKMTQAVATVTNNIEQDIDNSEVSVGFPQSFLGTV